jgi:hypothetical protein
MSTFWSGLWPVAWRILELMKILPTGRTVKVQGMTLFTVQDGQMLAARASGTWPVCCGKNKFR